ncbi:hypothetical protein [Leifsonia sp. TF02-11]|uniref:hypothetical protein n=1 Tax=Leifsonia sp. TF02-11 TaxID=2815212 RepID=UPI001AA0FA30|nr:hypothetical protein [Leifsonia sp. TF02-11]MBO1739428.1 hypothetical protein [Leifsonia sp. TF02-11]
MQLELDALLHRVREIGVADSSIERLPALATGSATGVFLNPPNDGAAHVEVWVGDAGWHVTVAEFFSREFPPADSRLAAELVLLCISTGVCVVSDRGRRWFVTGRQSSHSGDVVVRSCPAWTGAKLSQSVRSEIRWRMQ